MHAHTGSRKHYRDIPEDSTYAIEEFKVCSYTHTKHRHTHTHLPTEAKAFG